MSFLRIFRKAGHAVQLPRLPRDEADGANMASIDPAKSLPANA